MSIDQELPGLSRDINASKSTYLYDRQIITLNANTCHKNVYKSNDNHTTR